MVEGKGDPYAPVLDEQGRQRIDDVRINVKAAVIGERLYNEYIKYHEVDEEKEKERFNDGCAWAGPAKFVLPINLVRDHCPNMRILGAVERALSNIVDWPNARGQAYQLGRYIGWGGDAGGYKGIFQVSSLVAKIAHDKPYGDQTIGTKLLRHDWNWAWGEGSLSDVSYMQGLFRATIKSLTDFSKGRYLGCLGDYPHGPFYMIKQARSLYASPEQNADLVQRLIRDRYPILLEQPDLAKRHGLMIS